MEVRAKTNAPNEDKIIEKYLEPIENMDMPPTEAESEEQQIDPLVELAAMLEGIEGAPDIYDLEAMRDKFGSFHVSSVQEDDTLYIWKTLKRSEYKAILGSGAANNEITMQDAVVRKCLMYPEPSSGFIATSDAGVMPTLFKQMMHKSGFIPENMALALINTI